MYGPVGSTVSFTFGSTSIMSARAARASDCTSRGYGASISLSVRVDGAAFPFAVVAFFVIFVFFVVFVLRVGPLATA